MQRLVIEASKSTPHICFDPTNDSLSIRGQSYPENAFEFYEPVLEWTKEYLDQLETEATVEIDFTLAYINTSSSKCIMMLLEQFDQAYLASKNITLKWYYDVDNESEMDCAEEFTEDLRLPFALIPQESDER